MKPRAASEASCPGSHHRIGYAPTAPPDPPYSPTVPPTDTHRRDDPSLRNGYRDAARTVRQCSSNFYWGMRLTPPPKRSAMYVIYAWMRRADDAVDDAVDQDAAAVSLERFATATRAAFDADAASETDFWRAFADATRRHGLSREPFDRMIAGQRSDLDFQTPADWSALQTYCRGVASTVGRVCVELWGYRDGAALEQADARGIALQHTNILRDIREDAEAGRCYLPADEIDGHGIGRDDTGSPRWEPTPAFDRFMRFQIDRARSWFEASRGLEDTLHADGRRSCAMIGGVYRVLLDRIARDPRSVLNGRVRVPNWRKLGLLLRPQVSRSTALHADPPLVAS